MPTEINCTDSISYIGVYGGKPYRKYRGGLKYARREIKLLIKSSVGSAVTRAALTRYQCPSR